MFLIFHCVNIAVLLMAVWFYLHPFESVRPTMLWIGAAHAIAFASFMMVACQVLLFEFKRGPWGIRLQLSSIMVLLLGGFFYWVFDPAPFRVLSFSLAALGAGGFIFAPALPRGLLPSGRAWSGGTSAQSVLFVCRSPRIRIRLVPSRSCTLSMKSL